MCARKGEFANNGSTFPELWVTRTDLELFKQELLTEIKALLEDHRPQGAKKWLRSYQVKEMLNISAGTLQTLRLNGTLPYTKMGGSLFYDPNDLQKVLEKLKKQTSFK